MTLEGGSGGGGTSTTYTSNIPDYLQPQTEALLGAATQEYFDTTRDPETGKFDITGVRPFTPFSTTPSDYVAGFNPQQERVFSQASGMTRPGGFETGTQLVGAAGQGAMGSAREAFGFGNQGQRSGLMGQDLGVSGGEFYGGMGTDFGSRAAGLAPEAQMYGRTAADIGAMGLRSEALGRDVGQEARQYARQAAGMGDSYQRMATDPQSIQAFMSPYQQSVTEIAKRDAIENAQRAQLGQNLGAVRTGTYGGARQALALGQREAGLQKTLSDLDVRGRQEAFEQAQRAQQFGVTTGLQGLQGAQSGLGTALQGGQLGLSGIGAAMSGQQAGLAGLGQAGQLLGQGIQGAQVGLSGLDRQLAGTGQGMQGAQVGLQGIAGAQAGFGLAGQQGQALSNIAQQQQASDIARMGFQSDIGLQQQAREQQIIDQAIQNFASTQESPFQRLSQYSGLLRGYSTPTLTQESYRATNPAQTLIGGATSLIGAGMPGRKKGGVIEEGIDTLAIKRAKRKKVKA